MDDRDKKSDLLLINILSAFYSTSDFQEWLQDKHPEFKNLVDFEKKLFSIFTMDEILSLPLSFWVDYPPVKRKKFETFDDFVQQIREELKRRQYFSVGTIRSIQGKPLKFQEIKAGDTERAYKLILQYGELTFFPSNQLDLFTKKEMMTGLSTFERKLYDYYISHMAPDGRVPVVKDRQRILSDFKLSNAGKHWKKITDANLKFASIDWRCSIKIPNPDKKSKNSYIVYPADRMLKFPERWDEDGRRIRKRGYFSIPYLPAHIIQLKQAGNYLVYLEERMFGLDPETYMLIRFLYEMFRLNISKPEFPLNLDSLISQTDWTMTVRHEKDSLKKLHNSLNDMVKDEYIAGYSITENGRSLTKFWYNDKKYKFAIKNKSGKTITNRKMMSNIIYHFVPTEKFKSKHEKIIEHRTKQIEKTTN